MRSSKVKLTDITGVSPPKDKNQAHYIVPRKLTDPESARSMTSRRSRYTTSSKLTNSQLFTTLSRANLASKKEEEKKDRNLEIQILNNTLESIKNSEHEHLLIMAKKLEEYSNLADKLMEKVQNHEI